MPGPEGPAAPSPGPPGQGLLCSPGPSPQPGQGAAHGEGCGAGHQPFPAEAPRGLQALQLLATGPRPTVESTFGDVFPPRLGRRGNPRSQGPCRLRLGSTSRRAILPPFLLPKRSLSTQWCLPSSPGAAVSSLCPSSPSADPRGAPSLPSRPASRPGLWCSSRGCTSPSSPGAWGGQLGSSGPAWASGAHPLPNSTRCSKGGFLPRGPLRRG